MNPRSERIKGESVGARGSRTGRYGRVAGKLKWRETDPANLISLQPGQQRSASPRRLAAATGRPPDSVNTHHRLLNQKRINLFAGEQIYVPIHGRSRLPSPDSDTPPGCAFAGGDSSVFIECSTQDRGKIMGFKNKIRRKVVVLEYLTTSVP
ncbi:hypothetical protein E2C01_023102 [Portunus trituberculatus]|uniref:Uncharacterized protein n=1 Tax=Portunus trituberculatus TaxID=210409 RepID=A0A5B7E757_PORTR|nr:hypothetical protein [Portunus trituberculatus]